jgi:hypothetical protein
MVAFIIFGGFALVRRIGRVFLIPVLAARSASAGAMWRRADNGSLPRRWPHGVHLTVICYLIGMAVFATALAARSASAKADKLCLYHAP